MWELNCEKSWAPKNWCFWSVVLDKTLESLWVWVNFGRWWWTGRPGMLWFMGSQRVRHDWAIELNWSDVPSLLTFWRAFSFFPHKWALYFVKSFFCIYWNDYMVFILNLLIWYITFIDLYILKHPWDESHLIMVCDPSNVFLGME